ncbi:MAG: SMP-30/gluconolactonase/LRE family protein [Pseudomonadota bacterium]|nr:SMP-30/gluconolactonase/LRE family protein [Pseudomonadota bacterium]
MSASTSFNFTRDASAWKRPVRWLLAGSLAALLSLAACGGSGSEVDRGPTQMPVAAKLNGLYWDAGESRLYLTDDNANAIRQWDGDKGFPVSAAMTTAPDSGANMGQIARMEGTFYVTRFGFGRHGAVVAVPRTGAAYDLKGLDPARRRIGLAPTPDGKLLVGWFRGGAAGGNTGTISELTVQGDQGSERELVTGLGKPAGLAVVGDTFYVTDQNSAQLLAFSLAAVRAESATAADARVVATFVTSDQLDLMTAGADGTLYFGGAGGSLFAASPAGEVRRLAQGWSRVRGVALDERNSRLFAIDAGAQASDPSFIRIVPID